MGGPDRRATGGWSRSRPGGGAAAGEFSQSSQPVPPASQSSQQPASQPARAGSPRLLRSCSAAPSARPTDGPTDGSAKPRGRAATLSTRETTLGLLIHPWTIPTRARTWTWYGFARFRSGRCDRRSGAALRNHVGAGRQTHVRHLLLVAPIELNLPECSANDARPARDSCPPARPPARPLCRSGARCLHELSPGCRWSLCLAIPEPGQSHGQSQRSPSCSRNNHGSSFMDRPYYY